MSYGVSSGDARGGSYLSLVDGVRGIAALAILFYHYVHFFMAGPSRHAPANVGELFPGHRVFWPLFDYGYFAVQIFWLISGFVFAHVYYGHSSTTRSFLVNRFARLYPLHLLTLLLVAGLQLVALARLGYTPIYANFDLAHFLPQLVMASDWVRQGNGYSFNGPVWSVSVEIVVYAAFWLTRGPVTRFGLPLVAALIAGAYLGHSHWGATTKVFACGFYFFSGCGLCLLRSGPLGEGRRLALPVVALLALGGCGLAEGSDWGWRYLGIPGLFGALFLVLASLELRAPASLRKACEWLGQNTYGIYLWHFPLQLALLLLLMPANASQEVARNWWFLLGFIALVVAVAQVSYVRFERPARNFLRQRLGGARRPPKGGDNAP